MKYCPIYTLGLRTPRLLRAKMEVEHPRSLNELIMLLRGFKDEVDREQ